MFIVDGIAYAGEPIEGIKVVNAKTVNDLCMLVDFSNGETRLFDATQLSGNPVFAPLTDQTQFSKFSIECGVMCWLEGAIDIAPERMYDLSYQYERIA